MNSSSASTDGAPATPHSDPCSASPPRTSLALTRCGSHRKQRHKAWTQYALDFKIIYGAIRISIGLATMSNFDIVGNISVMLSNTSDATSSPIMAAAMKTMKFFLQNVY
jgi:hypothetical protein